MRESITKFLCSCSSSSSKSTTLSLQKFMFLVLLLLLLLQCSFYQIGQAHSPTREALEIVIGGGGDYGSPAPETSQNCPPPPPPPPPCPPPPPSPSQPSPQPPSPFGGMLRVDVAKISIQRFRKRITSDPFGITKSWTGRNACDYTGFRCGFIHKFGQAGVYGVDFNGFNFGGPNLGVDGFIDTLPDLSYFHANSNGLKGSIPDLSKLPFFFELDLSHNKYVGEFPSTILKIQNLLFLDLRFNSFSGRVPAQIFNFKLLALFLNNNYFEQDVPQNLGSTPALFLTLASNKFTGQIPNSIGQAKDTLLEVDFNKNNLMGCLPYEIGLLKKARVFDASQNQLTGPIPLSFACLAKMNYLILGNNQLYGPVPELVCKLQVLLNVSLCNKYFTQVGPVCMELIRRKVLDVSGNCIVGQPNQRSAKDCDSFFNQPKYCPESNMYNYIPCQGKAAYLDSDVASERVPQHQPTVSYHALDPTHM